jgi:hypothetical protein
MTPADDGAVELPSVPEQVMRRSGGDIDLAVIVGDDVDAVTLPVPLYAPVSRHFMQTTMGCGRGGCRCCQGSSAAAAAAVTAVPFLAGSWPLYEWSA